MTKINIMNFIKRVLIIGCGGAGKATILSVVKYFKNEFNSAMADQKSGNKKS